jgi:hypothetical protein
MSGLTYRKSISLRWQGPKPIQSTVFISHLTNSNRCGILYPGFVDVSPFSSSFFPQPYVYPQTRNFCRPFVFNGLPALFLSCASFSHPDRLFSIACPLFDKNTGGPLPSPLPHLRRLLRSHPLFVSTFRINTCISVASKQLYLPLESTLVKKGGRGEGVGQEHSGVEPR